MIKIIAEKNDTLAVQNADNFFYQLLSYAKKNKNKFLYVKSDQIAFKRSTGSYVLNKSGNPQDHSVIVRLNGRKIGSISSVEELKHLIDTGKIR